MTIMLGMENCRILIHVKGIFIKVCVPIRPATSLRRTARPFVGVKVPQKAKEVKGRPRHFSRQYDKVFGCTHIKHYAQ